MPSVLPIERNSQAKSIHLRTADDPLVVEAAGDERGDGEGERDRAPDEARCRGSAGG